MIGDSHTAACSGLAVRPSVVAAESKTLKRVKSETALDLYSYVTIRRKQARRYRLALELY